MLTIIFILAQSLYIFTNAQVIFSSIARTWADAQADCESRGTDLLTAQGNPTDIQECADATNAKVWVGLNRVNQNAWRWVADDVLYDRDEVNWQGRGPGSNARAGDCVVLITNGRREGQVTNTNTQCTDTKRYCCNPIPVPTTSTTSPITTAAPTTTSSNHTSCPRIRKEWNTMDQSERDLYINGILQLANDDKLDKFTEQHGQRDAEAQAHGTSGFLTWHRLFLWELETQIRNLGGDYECFGLPYWNIGKEVADYGYQYSQYTILNSGLGGAGDINDNYCVTDGAFTEDAYEPYLCPIAWRSNAGKCCLRRRTLGDSQFSGWLDTNAEDANSITKDDFYGRDDTARNVGIRKNLELGQHGAAHCTIGGCGGGHLGDGLYSPSDPIFYLLHGYIDFLWAVWQDYNNYDLIDKADLSGKQYDGRLPNSGIDTPLVFDVLIEESWSTLDGTQTSRDMHSIVDLGYSYSRGSFISDVNFNETNLNNDWFIPDDDDTIRRRRRIQQSNIVSYEQILYNRLKSQYGNDLSTDSKESRRQIFESLATMSCEYMNVGDHECRRPKNFDDFSDIPLGPNRYNNHNDLDKSLDELIEAVKDYPCMVETRQLMFEWVSKLGGIWRLARGDFDRFCDKNFLRQENEEDITLRRDQCIDRGYIRNHAITQEKENFVVNNMEHRNMSTVNSLNLEMIAIIMGLIIILCGCALYLRSNDKQNEHSLLNAMNNIEQYSSI